MKLEGAIFDFDGTLFDTTEVWDSVGARFVRSMGQEPKPDLGARLRTMSLEDASRCCKEEYDQQISIPEVMRGFNKIIESHYFYEAQPKPGARDLVEKLHAQGVRMCVATATDRYLIEAALRRCEMEDYFSDILTCTDLGHDKNEPFIFRTALDRLGTTRETTLVFEDALHAVRTAVSDSFRVVCVFDAYEPGTALARELSSCYLSDFLDLRNLWDYIGQNKEKGLPWK